MLSPPSPLPDLEAVGSAPTQLEVDKAEVRVRRDLTWPAVMDCRAFSLEAVVFQPGSRARHLVDSLKSSLEGSLSCSSLEWTSASSGWSLESPTLSPLPSAMLSWVGFKKPAFLLWPLCGSGKHSILGPDKS